MAECTVCGTTDALMRTCNHCGTTVCPSHILPENHDCIALDNPRPDSRHLESDITAKQDADESPKTLGDTEPESSSVNSTVGTPKTPPELDSSPDVAADGSLATETAESPGRQQTGQQSSRNEYGLTHTLGRIWSAATGKYAVTMFVFLIVGVGQLGLAPIPGFPMQVSESGTPVDNPVGAAADAARDAAGVSDTRTGVHQRGINLTKTERVFLTYLNRERSSRGLQNVSHRDALTEMGREHSRDMAEDDYFKHTEPGGVSIEDRYRSRDLLPECRLPIKNSDKYYPGAENIAKWQLRQEMRVTWTDDGTFSASNARETAYALFQMWMNSRGHREAMLVYSADEAGLGLYIDKEGVVHASLELC